MELLDEEIKSNSIADSEMQYSAAFSKMSSLQDGTKNFNKSRNISLTLNDNNRKNTAPVTIGVSNYHIKFEEDKKCE